MPDLALERAGPGPVAGVDEAGRGPLAGPVVAAAVILDERSADSLARLGLDDSKRLTRRNRDALFTEIHQQAVVGVGAAGVTEIEDLNILHATMLAMERAVWALGTAPARVLVDGNRVPAFRRPPPQPASRPDAQAVVGGDGRCLSIAAASVIAKVTRDRIMERLARRYPAFGWERNAGYGTAEHRAALTAHGPTPHHRRAFAPVAQLVLALAESR